jgi:hypothetical protein
MSSKQYIQTVWKIVQDAKQEQVLPLLLQKKARTEAEQKVKEDRIAKRVRQGQELKERITCLDIDAMVLLTADDDDTSFNRELTQSVMSCISPELNFADAVSLALAADPTSMYVVHDRLSQWLHPSISTPPTLKALLAFKDHLMIGDRNWSFVRKTFGLGKDYSLSLLKALQRE